MSHELELFRNGDAAFYSARETAWHRLGTVTPDALTIPDALEVSHLGGWDLEKQPIVTVGHSGTPIEVPGKYAVVRRHPDPELEGTSDVLGVVGEDYTIVQNEEAFGFLGGLVDDGEVTIETAGSLRGGKRVFVTMKLPNGVVITDDDTLDLYLAVATGHDGLFAFQAFPTPVRVVCKNTLGVALSGATNVYRMLHTDGVGLRIQEAREAIKLTFTEGDVIGKAAREMLQQGLTNAAFDKLIASNFVQLADHATDSTKRRVEQKRDDLRVLFRDAPTQEVGRGTRWAAYNAIAEWSEWVAPRDNQAERSSESVLMGKAAGTRQKAWNLLAPAWATA